MSGSALVSLSGGSGSSTGYDTYPAWYPPSLDVMPYIRDFSSYLDTLRFSTLPSVRPALTILLWSGTRNTNAGMCRKRWKYWGGCGALTLKKEFREIDSPIVQCREKNEQQQQLAALLEKVPRRAIALTVLAQIYYDILRTWATLLFHQSRLLVNGSPLRAACVWSATVVLQVGVSEVIQRNIDGPAEVLLQCSGMVATIRGPFFVVPVYVVDTVL